MRIVRIVAIALGVYVLLCLAFDSVIGYRQPQFDNTAVLRSFDANGEAHDTVLGLLDDDGQLWVQSGHWFRGWYRRVLANGEVQLIRDGEPPVSYRAMPLDTPEAVETVTRLMGKGTSNAYWVVRAMLLFAPIKPVRLDPSS